MKTKETTTNEILLDLLKQNGYAPIVFDDGLYAITFMGEDIVLHVHEDRHSVTLQDMYWCHVNENEHEILLNVKRLVNELNSRGISKLVLNKDDDKYLVSTMLTVSLVIDIQQLSNYLNNQFKNLLFHRGVFTPIDYEQLGMEPDSVDYEVAPLVFDALQELACNPELYSYDRNENIWFSYENEYLMVRIDNNHPIAKIVYHNWYQFPLADFSQFEKVSEIVNDINNRQNGTTLYWQIDEQNQRVLISAIDRFFVTENREETILSIKQIVPDLISVKQQFELMLEASYEANNQGS